MSRDKGKMGWLARIKRKVVENFPYFMGVLALLMGFSAWGEYKSAKLDSRLLKGIEASATWPATEGRIVQATIDEKMAGSFSHSPFIHHYASVRYDYVVDGKRYRGWRICFDYSNCKTGTTDQKAQALLDQYPKDMAVKVYYNPDAPEFSTLRPGGRADMARELRMHWIFMSLSIFLCLLFAFITARTADEFKSPPEEEKADESV